MCHYTRLAFITSLANNASPSDPRHSCNVLIVFILIYLVKHAPFLPVLINARFAAHGARHKVLFPSRNQDTLVYTLRTRRTDPGRPIAITTCNHNRTQSFGHALILTISYAHHCPPVIDFPFPFSNKRKEAGDANETAWRQSRRTLTHSRAYDHDGCLSRTLVGCTRDPAGGH